MLKLLLVLVVFAVLVADSETAPTHKNKNKDDPYKPYIRLLKELRKQRKYKNKYGGGSSHFGGSWETDDSDESWEENPFHGGFHSSRPSSSTSNNNRPFIFPSPGSGGTGSGGNFGSGGGNTPSVPFLQGGENGGGSQVPIEQANGGVNNVLQSLRQLTLGQLLEGIFS